jgi:ACS family hexuronate transporter-like MFS transporter
MTHGNYLPVFVLAGFGYLLAIMFIHLLAPRLEMARID